MTTPVEIEVNAPTVEVETPPQDTVDEVDLNHESRLTALEITVAGLIAAQQETAATAEVALDVATDAEQLAVEAMDTAVEAEIVADSVGDAVEEIAETTATQEDDAIAEEVIIEPDVPARRPNLMFDDRPFERIRK